MRRDGEGRQDSECLFNPYPSAAHVDYQVPGLSDLTPRREYELTRSGSRDPELIRQIARVRKKHSQTPPILAGLHLLRGASDASRHVLACVQVLWVEIGVIQLADSYSRCTSAR